MTVLCSVTGCKTAAASQGFCQKHYMRLWRHGDTDDHRPIGYGSKVKHSVYNSWNDLKRLGRLCDEWLDFWTFANAVGERPKRHSLARHDESIPFGPGNWYWRQKIAVKKDGETDKQYQARAQRIRRKLHPEEIRTRELKRRFGITDAIYQEMYDARDGLCDICGQPETLRTNRSAGKKMLAIDHDHKTKKIRGLLCSRCNAGVGYFGDSIHNIEAALRYLKKHRA